MSTLVHLLCSMEGGVYSDTDTICLKPISQWGQNPTLLHGQPKSLLKAPPSVIIGVEADVGMRADWHQWWPRPLQIVQWTLTSAPHHPIFLDVLRRILIASERAKVWTEKRDALAKRLRQEGRDKEAKKVEGWKVLTHKGADEDEEIRGEVGTGVSVMDWTGPGVWTDGVFA
jgi:alpha 1,6-mannosyltransferase